MSGQGFVEVPHHPSLNIGSNGMTLTLWTWPTLGSGGPQPLVEKYDVAGGDGYSLYLDPVASGNFVLKFLLNGTVVTGPTVVASASPSDWRFVVAHVDGGGNVTLWVCDAFGSCAVTPTVVVANFTTTNTAPLWFGKSVAINPALVLFATRVGFDEIELFDRALTKPEIQQIYDAEKSGTRKCATPPGGTEVCIFKFEDTNGNGQPDPGEAGLPGWQFTISPPPLAPTTSPVTTGPDGRICFAVAAPGTYTITEIGQPGWTPTTPVSQTITVAAGQLTNLFFGNRNCVPAPAGMVAWWPLDEVNGALTFAELQAGLNANIVPGPLGTPPSPNAMPGQVAGGAYFPNGSVGYGDVPSAPALDVAGANFTIDAWIYPIGCSPQHVSPIVDKLRLGDPSSGYALGLLGGQLVLALGDPLAGGQLYTCTLPLPLNTWNFVGVSVDFAAGTVNFFVNGSVQTLSSPAPAPKLPNASSLWIGGTRIFFAQPPYPPCEIGLDEIELFNRALSPNELGQIFAAGPAGKCKPQPPSKAQICIVKFHDLNGNGVQDPNEPPLPGWQFTVNPPPLAPTTSPVTTGPDGRICFAVAAPGTYTITEVVQTGWTPTTPATQTVTVQPGQVVNLPFGNLGCVPPPANMTAWWPLDETTGPTANDLAGMNNQGTHMNGPTPIPGMVAGALHFDGLDDHVLVPDQAELDVGTNDFTLDAWVRTTAAQGVVVLVDKRSGPTPLGYSLFLVNGRLGFQMANGVGNSTCAPVPTPNVACVNYVATAPNVADGQWHHVAAVVDRADPTGGVRLYVDGALVFTGVPLGAPPSGNPATPANLDNTSDLYLGMRTPGMNGEGFFPGDLDEVELIQRALTVQEVQALFLVGPAGKCRPCPDLVEVLNTGWDQSTSAVIPVGGQDNDWTVTADPDPNTAEPRPADVVASNWGAPPPNSQWISFRPTSQPVIPTPTEYRYEYCFCLAEGFSNAQLNLDIRADDTVLAVLLNGVQIGGPGGSFQGPPLNVQTTNQTLFRPGRNCVTIIVQDIHGVYTGLNVTGTVTAENGFCCLGEPGHAEICIVKFHDLNGNGVQDPNEPPLPGWQFTVNPPPLAPTTSPVTTGPDGRICFAVAAPGTYTITEVVQTGWTPTTPATQTVTVQPGQVVNLPFGNLGCVPPPANMTAWWPLDEATGTVNNDLALFNNQGTPNSIGMAPLPASVAAVVGTGLNFASSVSPAGPNSYVEVPDNAEVNFGTSDFTIDAWIKLGQMGPAGGIYPIVDKLDFTAPVPNKGYAFFVQNGQLLLRLGPDNSGGLVGAVSSAPPLTPGYWYHVAVTVTRGPLNPVISFYVNGLPVGSSSPPGPGMSAGNNVDSSTPLWIGGNSRLAGGGATVTLNEITIDELEFFKHALSASDIWSIFSAGPAGKCKPPPCQAGFLCPTNKIVECGTTWTFDPPISTVPGCDLQILSFTTVTNLLQPCGQRIVGTWQFVDCCGHTNTCTQVVTTVDTTPPVFTCPSDQVVQCGSLWKFVPPTALDACCGTNVTITVVNTVTNVLSSCQRTITRTWEARDCCDNTATCSQTVTVVDTTPPIIKCPGPIIRFVCTNGMVVHYNPVVIDNCSGPVTVSCTPPSGSFFPLGTTVVTCTATDACGNTSTCTFPVTVINNALWVTLPRGWPDCYAQPTEPAVPGPCLTSAYGSGFWKNFDDPTVDRRLGVRWNFPLNWNILNAFLWTRLRPPVIDCLGSSANDSISLGLTSCSPPAWLWSRYLGSGNPSPGLFNFQWCNGPTCNHNLALNLAALPLVPNGTVNLLPHMNTTHRLEMFVQDDTTVDFARLRVRRCVPLEVGPVGGLDTTPLNARIVHGPDLWTLAPEEPGAPFGAEIALGEAPGLLVLIEPLALAGHPGAHLEFETLDAEGAPGIGLRLEAGDAGQGRVLLSRLPAGVTNIQVELILERNGVVIEQQPSKPFNAGDLLATFAPADPLIELGVLDGRELRASALSREEDGSTNTYTLRALLRHNDADADEEPDGTWHCARLMASGLPELPLQSPGLQLRGIEKKDIRRGMVIAKRGLAPSILLAQDDQVVVTPLDDQTGLADVRVSFPPTDEVLARVPSFFDVFIGDPIRPFETNGTVKAQKQWLRIQFQTGEETDLCVTEFVQGTNGLWTLTLPEVGQPTEGGVQRVILKGPGGQTSIVPQPGSAGGVLLGQCAEPPLTRGARINDPRERQQRLLISRFVWPQPVLFQAPDGTSVQTIALEIYWRMPGDDGGLIGLGLESTGAHTLAVGGLELGPQARGLHIAVRDEDANGILDVIEVRYDADGGMLEEAPTIQGPWTPVPDQFEQGVGRYTIPVPLQVPDKAARFYRVRY